MSTNNESYTIERNSDEENGKLKFVSFHVSDKKNKTEQWFSIRRRDDTILNNGVALPNIQVALKNDKSDETMFVDMAMEKEFERTMGTMDGLMNVYYKVSHSTSLAPLEQRCAVLDFMDNYFFNTSDTREVLNSYMQNLEDHSRLMSVRAGNQKKNNILTSLVQKFKSLRK